MATLTAVVIALSIAVAVNFVLLLAIVRRLRLQRPAPRAIDLPQVGTRAPTFSAQDADGQPIDDSFFAEHDEATVAFFSDNCEPCERIKTELARDPITGPFLAFVQVSNGVREHNEFVAELARGGARTVLFEPGSDLLKLFSVSAFPTLMRLRAGIVVASSIKLADVRNPAEVAGASRRKSVAHPRSRAERSDQLIRK